MAPFRDRHPRQPWLYPLTDLRPQGAPEAQTFTGDEVWLWLHIRGVNDWLGIKWGRGEVTALIPSEPMDAEDGA